MNGAERLDRMRDLGRSDYEQGHPQRSPDELLALLPIPGLSPLATQLAGEQLWVPMSFTMLCGPLPTAPVDTVIRLQGSQPAPRCPRVWKRSCGHPIDCTSSHDPSARSGARPRTTARCQALHDAAMRLAGYAVTGRDGWVRDCVEWAVLPHLRRNARPPAELDPPTAGGHPTAAMRDA